MDELKIIQYLDGEMSGEEKREFEEEIKQDRDLAEEVRKFREIQDLARKLLSVQEADEGELDAKVENEIEEAVKQFKQDPKGFGQIPDDYRDKLIEAGRALRKGSKRLGSVKTIRRIWYGAAAVILIAIILSILITKPFTQLSPNDVYTQYFSTVKKTNEITEFARADNDFLFAIEVYEAGDYERAAVLFAKLADSSVFTSWSLYYAGSAYMSLNQTTNAIDYFNRILKGDDPEVVSHARWQLALCFLKKGETEQAHIQLNQLRDNPFYRKDAMRVLRLLR